MTREQLSTDRGFDDGLEEELAAALGNEPEPQQERQPAPQEPAPQPQQPPQQDDPFPRSQPRTADGKFAAKQQEQPQEGRQPPEEGVQPPLREWQPLWLKDEHGVEWSKLPEPFRKMIEQRERESAQAITQHSTRAKVWEPLDRMFEEVDPATGRPYMEQLEQAGISKQEYFSNLAQWDKNFREDPIASALHLLGNLGITPDDLAKHAATVQAQPGQGNGQAAIDPQALQRAIDAAVNSALAAKSADTSKQEQHAFISEWAKDKPYFPDLRKIMVGLAEADPKATLDELYERAQYAHPTLRQRILTDQRKAEADRARRAGVSTRGFPQGATAKNAKLSLDEELGAGWDEMFGGGAV